MSKLTARNVLHIRKMLAEGQSQTEIAAKFGVTSANIQAISKKRSWGWLTYLTDSPK